MANKNYRSPSLHWLHWCVFFASIVLTLGVWFYSSQMAVKVKNEKIQREANQVVSLIQERMAKYADALSAGVAFMAASKEPVTHKEWRVFSKQLQLESKYPGINGIGVIYVVPRSELKAFSKRQKQEGNPLTVYPAHTAPVHLPITYIEPIENNQRALGLDVAHEKNRYEAATLAGETGKPMITGPIILVQDHKKTPGFLLYMPFYQGSEGSLKRLAGYVYAPFIVSKLMNGVLAKESRYVSLRIADSKVPIFQDAEDRTHGMKNSEVVTKQVAMYGRQWAISIFPTPFFLATLSTDLPKYILIIGFLFDFSLLFIFIVVVRSRSNAIRYAKVLTRDLETQANQDFLTALPNRLAFMRAIEDLLANDKNPQFSILFLDLDNFKNVNDTLGHLVGDELLKAVADRLKELIAEQSQMMGFVARLGGDEFAILLEGPDLKQAAIVFSDLVHETMSADFVIKNHKLKVSFSIGVAMNSIDKNTERSTAELIKVMLKKADIAMYEAKNKGKNQYVVYDQTLQERNEKKQLIELSLQNAIEDEDFYMEFQGIHDTKTLEYIGAEALLRWNHPSLGLVPPMSYIPFAERTRDIIPLGYLIFKMVFKEMSRWRTTNAQQSKKMITINCSTVQFEDEVFEETLFALMATYQIKPEEIVLEVTETALMKNMKKTLRVLNSIANKGVRLAIDDFGTGYSSLNYLDQLPVSFLKIDRSFTTRILTENSDIISNIIRISHSSGIQVIAEGVESIAQIDYLQMKNCDYLQGYYFDT